MAKFAETLKCLRLSRKITQAELAKALGVSPSTVGMYEAGERQPNFEMEEKIADYFNVTLDTLRGIKEEKNPDSQAILDKILDGSLKKLNEPNKARLLAYYQALLDTQEDEE